MKKGNLLLMFLLFEFTGICITAQINVIAQPIPDRTVSFDVESAGVYKPITWGLDLAWLSEGNIRRGIAFMGSDRVDVVRSSFIPTDPIVNGQLSGNALLNTNLRLNIINSWLGTNTKVVLNCDHPSIDPSFAGNAVNWAQLIDITRNMHQQTGRTVITVSPFNEPDNYSTGQGTMTDFYNICGELKNNPNFNNIRICGGNTLNDDEALSWYNYLKTRLDEGNTHQLAGNFDNYANFFQTVRANGDHASNDELHNVMEAMVGVEYGMQTGIWWGTAEYARGEFVKASDGDRLGYAEHRNNWTAASVYRATDGKIQAFGGTSERQAGNTSYRFVSKDRDVYYDGHGPQREYTMVMPGGTGYQNGQTNAERVVNITWGDDIQPVINGRYIVVNRNSGKVMEVAGGSTVAGANLQQGASAGVTYQQWNVTPVDSRIGGDFSYFTFTAVHSGMSPDILNWSLDNGGDIITYNDVKGANQQWYLEYAGDGWFYIRSRHSAKCMDVYNHSTADGGNICQWDKTGAANQQWRFLPVDAAVEFISPNAPSNLIATANAESVRLDWTASTSADVTGYTIYRSETSDGLYSTIARNVTTTFFVDNSTTNGGQHFYRIKAVDKSLNFSEYSNEVFVTPTGLNSLVCQLKFDGNTLDHTENLNHSASYGNISYVTGKSDNAIMLNGSDAFLQLSASLLNQQSITIATWVYWNGGSNWQRIFDFGNDQSQYMFLSPSSGDGTLRFAIKNGGSEQILDAPALSVGEWAHVAVSLGASGAEMYVNGTIVAQSGEITIRPIDFTPILNYIGRSQYPDPLFNGRIDDFRVYNYDMSAQEISELINTSGVQSGHIYMIQAKHSGRMLDVVGSTNGSQVVQFDNWNNPNQKWALDKDAQGYWSLTPQNATSRSLDVPGCNFTNGIQMNIWDTYGNDCQKFQIANVGNGYYQIKIKDGSKCFDVWDASLDNLAAVTLWDCHTGDNQQWSFIDIGLKSVAIPVENEIETGALQISVFPTPVENELFVVVDNYKGQVIVDIFSIDGRIEKNIVGYIDGCGKIVIDRWGYEGFGVVSVTAGLEIKNFKIKF